MQMTTEGQAAPLVSPRRYSRAFVVVAQGLALLTLLVLSGLPVVESAEAATPKPYWWDGDCDANNNPGSKPFIYMGNEASYRGVKACHGGEEKKVQFTDASRNALGQRTEWDCVELVTRYMYLVHGVAPYKGNGKDVVWNYSGKLLKKVYNNGKQLPSPGDILSMGTSGYGHAAIVTAVNVDRKGNGSVITLEQNAGNNAPEGVGEINVINKTLMPRTAKITGWLHAPQQSKPKQPAQPAPKPSSPKSSSTNYAGHIVQWDGDTNSQKTSWLVTPDRRRLWIPDTDTYQCLKAKGAPGPTVLSASALDQLPDMTDRMAPCGNSLEYNHVLRRNMELRSGDGRYVFRLQGDGNLVLKGPSGRPLWDASHSDIDWLVMHKNGNLVGYAGGDTTDSPVWATDTSQSGAYHLVVQNDGNVVLYSQKKVIWSTNTAGQT
jgi:hypothetical protein